MKNIRISEEVWDAIAERGKFGETEDDVLRRVFGMGDSLVPRNSRRASKRSTNRSTNRMSARCENNHLVIEFESGARNYWVLPKKSDKSEIRRIRDEAVQFALKNDATLGQVNAVKKALTNEEYYLSR
ncbi:hypothetical protein OAJ77_03265 [Rhodospirillales bacterium]|nr:hypothetical protein [Rhodospirillales bacterium]